MKKYLAILLAFMMVIFTFTACNDNVIVDKEGNEHKILTDGGEYVQDKYGNLIEEVTNADGEKVTQPVSYPDFIQNGKSEVENAYFVVDIPSGWSFDEAVKAFRIQHKDGCSENKDVFCEVSFEVEDSGDVQILLDNEYANELKLQLMQEDLVKDVEKFDTKLFGKDVKAYKCKYTTGSSVYFYAFSHAYTALGIKFIISDECAEKFTPEEFINKYITLKVFE